MDGLGAAEEFDPDELLVVPDAPPLLGESAEPEVDPTELPVMSDRAPGGPSSEPVIPLGSAATSTPFTGSELSACGRSEVLQAAIANRAMSRGNIRVGSLFFLILPSLSNNVNPQWRYFENLMS